MTVADAVRRPSAPVLRTESESTAALAPGNVEAPIDAVAAPVVVVDRHGIVLSANAACAHFLGVDIDRLVGEPVRGWIVPGVDDLVGSATPAHVRSVARCADGCDTPVEVSCVTLGDGPQARAVLTLRDLTTDQALERARDDTRELAEQLRRSQKIGALGRLAGGVAHDFNNLLQVVGGLAESLDGERVPRSARRRMARHIRRTTERGASLTRQLLAFGRRQVLVPETLDLNQTVQSLHRILRRVIGEDVELRSTLTAGLGAVRADPGQIEQVILNLALNARDAMRDGGILEIITSNFQTRVPWEHPALPVRVPPGEFVRLSVRDTGCGMDDTTAAQAFEPFFTTKDASSGSGLGLSMVYGIVKQSGGYTWIDTAPSAGTVVHVLLPAVEADAKPRGRVLAPLAAPPPATGSTLLLAEDDADVRGLFSVFLRRAGYIVHEAADGGQALALFDELSGDIDAVVTDVVMPGVSGPALASAIRTRRPDVKVLYVSGYTEQLDLGLDADRGSALLQKPVTRTALLQQLATLLNDAPPSRH